ncbi:TPA: hypothetical protein DCW61_04505 [Candidatus Uhrbacteria bacterium]|nr:hypothetical protein [Candidatus Uhrbacteria bacterium]
MQAAGSATMSLDQVAYQAKRGELFNVTVNVDPQQEALDTVRAVVTFNPTLISVQSVNLIGSFGRSAPGNYYDNTTGKVSWGVFTLEEPVTAISPVISITFLALQEGNGTIELSSDSKAIADGEEKINLSGLKNATIGVSASEQSDAQSMLIVVSSFSHPNEQDWYTENTVEFSWIPLEGTSQISAYYYSFDQNPKGDPTIYLVGSKTETSVEANADGIYYFHLKGIQKDGKETPVVHREVHIDTTAPNAIELTAQDTKILEGESVWLTFATTDETSGVLQYQIAMNDSTFQLQQSPLEITDLSAGTYFFRVAALDRAGNETYGATSVRVYPEGTDLERPAGYEESSEVQAILNPVTDTISDVSKSPIMLITLVLGVAVLFGIIYATRKQKK